MTNYIMASLAGFAVLLFWPVSRDRMIRNTSKVLASLVFSIGLLGAVSRLFLAGA